jgi:glucose-6-phosphate isomerase
MITFDISRAMSQTAGNNGVSDPVFKRTLQKAHDASRQLETEKLPVIERCFNNDDLAAIEQKAASVIQRFSTIVVCGMGGSSLSGRMLCSLAYNPVTHLSGKVRLLFVDNIDPVTIDTLTASLDYASTLFIIISKSGGTAETLAHTGILWHAANAALPAEKIKEHFLVITEPTDNPLARFAKLHDIFVMDHATDIGGRYAALTVVGLLPAAIAGLDIRAIRAGAAAVAKDTLHTTGSAATVIGAALSHVMAEHGKNISVMLPYCDRLWNFALWHRQIWAESLGKNGKGITPAPALGSLDQHSQLQLYLDGPRDKFFTLLLLEQQNKGARIPLGDEPALSYLHQRTLGDLMDAHQHATVETFTLKQIPLRVCVLPQLNETVLGALTMHFILETILTGRLMQVNPFDQPAVEDGKKLAIERLKSRA